MRKIVSMFMVMIMVMTLSITAFASDNASKGEGISPQANTAPPITSIEIEEGYYLKESPWYPTRVGHYIVPVSIMGYGSVSATFGGKSVSSYESKGILGSGNVAVGWVYYFDCGKPLPGEYVFEVKGRGWNSVNVIKATSTFTIL